MANAQFGFQVPQANPYVQAAPHGGNPYAIQPQQHVQGGFGVGAGGFGNQQRTCYRCNQPGHISRDCPLGGQQGQPQQQPGGFNAGPMTCYTCGQPGHLRRDCPMAQGGTYQPRPQPRTCYRCGQVGHISRDCHLGQGAPNEPRTCYKCGQPGHISRDCPQGGAQQGVATQWGGGGAQPVAGAVGFQPKAPYSFGGAPQNPQQ